MIKTSINEISTTLQTMSTLYVILTYEYIYVFSVEINTCALP